MGSSPSRAKALAPHSNEPGASPRVVHLVTSGCALKKSFPGAYSSGAPVFPKRAAVSHAHCPPSFAHQRHSSTFARASSCTGIMHWQIFSSASGNGSTPSKASAPHAFIPSAEASAEASLVTHFFTKGCVSKYPDSYCSRVPVLPKRMELVHAQCPPSFAHHCHAMRGAGAGTRHSHRAPGYSSGR